MTKLENRVSYPCRILSGKRVAIPKSIWKSLGWKVGDFILVKSKGNELEFVGVEFHEKHHCLNQIMEGDYDCEVCS